MISNETASVLERLAEDGAFAAYWDVQVYDLNACADLITEMTMAYEDGKPLFTRGLPPASKCLMEIGDYCILLTQEGDFVNTLMIQHLEIGMMYEELREKKQFVRDALAEGGRRAEDYRAALKRVGFDFALLDSPDEFRDLHRDVEAVRIGGLSTVKTPRSVLASCACEFAAMPIAKHEEGQAPRPVRRRLKRFGFELNIKTIRLSRSAGDYEPAHSPGARKALHYCSGHWRRDERSKNRRWVFGGWRIWIEGHWRGNPAYGTVLHRYMADKRDNATRRKLMVEA